MAITIKNLDAKGLWTEAGVFRYILGTLLLIGSVGFFKDLSLQTLMASLGQFGDMVGGMLNPLISLMALIWLRRSVLIQRDEMAETKAALKDTAESQHEMTNQAIKQTRIAALTALISSVTAEITILQSRLHFLLTQEGHRKGQGVYDQDGTYLQGPLMTDRIASLNRQIKRELDRQEAHENELRELLLVLTIEQSHDQLQSSSH